MDVKEVTLGVDEWQPVKRIEIRYALKDIDYIQIDEATATRDGIEDDTILVEWNRQQDKFFALSYFEFNTQKSIGVINSHVLPIGLLSENVLSDKFLSVVIRLNTRRLGDVLKAGRYKFQIRIVKKLNGVVASQPLTLEYIDLNVVGGELHTQDISYNKVETASTSITHDVLRGSISICPLTEQDTQALWHQYDFIRHFLSVREHDVVLDLDYERRPLAFPVARLLIPQNPMFASAKIRVQRIKSKEISGVKYIEGTALPNICPLNDIIKVSIGPLLLNSPFVSIENDYIEYEIGNLVSDTINGDYIQVSNIDGKDNIEGAICRYTEVINDLGEQIIYRIERLELTLIINDQILSSSAIHIKGSPAPNRHTSRSIIYASAMAYILSVETSEIIRNKLRISNSELEVGVENQVLPKYAPHHNIYTLDLKRFQKGCGEGLLFGRFKIENFKYYLVSKIIFSENNSPTPIELSVAPSCVISFDFGTNSTTSWALNTNEIKNCTEYGVMNYGIRYFSKEIYKSQIAIRLYPKEYLQSNPEIFDVINNDEISPLAEHFRSGLSAFNAQPFYYYLLPIVENAISVADPFYASHRRDRWWVVRSLKYDICERTYLRDYFKNEPEKVTHNTTIQFREVSGRYNVVPKSLPDILTKELLTDVLRALLEEKGSSKLQLDAYDLLTKGRRHSQESQHEAATLVFTYPASVGHAALTRYGDAAHEFFADLNRHQNAFPRMTKLIEPLVLLVDEARAVLETLKTVNVNDLNRDPKTGLLSGIWQNTSIDNQFLAIFDMGGGTIDISVWQWWGDGREPKYRSRRISYAIRLAGDCFDKAMRTDLAKLLVNSVGVDECWAAENIEEVDDNANQHLVREGLIILHDAKVNAKTIDVETELALNTRTRGENEAEIVTIKFRDDFVTGHVSSNGFGDAVDMTETSAFLLGLEQIAAGLADAIKGWVPEQETAEVACILSGQSFLFPPLVEAVKRGWKRIEGTVRRIDEVPQWRDNLVGPEMAKQPGGHHLKNVVAIGAARWAANREDMRVEEVSAWGVRGCFAWLQGAFCLTNGVFVDITSFVDLSKDYIVTSDARGASQTIWKRAVELKFPKDVVRGRFLVFRPTGYGAEQIKGAPDSIIDVCIRPAVHVVDRGNGGISALYHREGTAQILAADRITDPTEQRRRIVDGLCFNDEVRLSCPPDGTRVIISRDGQERHIELREIGAWGG